MALVIGMPPYIYEGKYGMGHTSRSIQVDSVSPVGIDVLANQYPKPRY